MTSFFFSHSSNLTSMIPMFPVTGSIASPTPNIFPINCPKTEKIADTTCLPISRIAKKPLKVFLIFAKVPSPILIPAVKSLNALVMSASLSPVIGGNISTNASLIGATRVFKTPQRFCIPSIRRALPPNSFHSSNTDARFSSGTMRSSYISSVRAVHSSLASS